MLPETYGAANGAFTWTLNRNSNTKTE
jgi:hypothetical protein